MKTWLQVKAESTCQKRVTVCEIFDKNGKLLARESNRCNPHGGVCERLAVTNGKADYPDAQCNWSHAEIEALNAVPDGEQPFRAVVYGHDFACPQCEVKLREAGVVVLDVVPQAEGCGPR